MDIGQFQKQDHGPFLFDLWKSNEEINSPLGIFNIELQITDNNAQISPNTLMLEYAQKLLSYLEKYGEAIKDIIFGHYLRCKKQDPEWLVDLNIPLNISRDEINNWLEDPKSLVVQYDQELDDYSSSFYIIPLWDTEHAINLNFKDNKIVALNDIQFKLDNNLLKFNYELTVWDKLKEKFIKK